MQTRAAADASDADQGDKKVDRSPSNGIRSLLADKLPESRASTHPQSFTVWTTNHGEQGDTRLDQALKKYRASP